MSVPTGAAIACLVALSLNLLLGLASSCQITRFFGHHLGTGRGLEERSLAVALMLMHKSAVDRRDVPCGTRQLPCKP